MFTEVFMKREEQIVIRRFIVIAMVGMLLVTPSQGEADSSSKISRREVTDSSQRNKTSGDDCVTVGIEGGGLKLPKDVLYGVRQNSRDEATASMFYSRLLTVNLAPGQEIVSFSVDADGVPKQAFSGPNCGANTGSGNGGSQTAVDPIEF